MIDISELAAIVTNVGQYLIQLKINGVVNGSWQGSQFKSEADILAQVRLTELLALLAPDIPVFGEEDKERVTNFPDVYWIVDPIDGTASFINGFSGYVTQAALMHNFKPIYAAIFAPEMNLLYLAQRGKGATLNGETIKRPLATSSISLIDNYPVPKGIAKALYDGLQCKKYIESGSIGLKIARIADSTATLFFKNTLIRDWDLAAPHLVLAEAGGILTNSIGEEIMYGRNEMNHEGCIAASDIFTHQLCLDWYLQHKANN